VRDAYNVFGITYLNNQNVDPNQATTRYTLYLIRNTTHRMHRRSLLILTLLPLVGFNLTCGQPSTAQLQKVELTYWRSFDDEDAFAPQIKRYSEIHPNIAIVYRKFRYEEYEQTLLNALSEDRGPDLFSIPNTWVEKFRNKVFPAPAELAVYQTVVDSGPQKRERAVQTRVPGPTPFSVARTFVDSVGQDAVRGTQVIGLPLAVDTLALYANTDLLARAGIPTPAHSWEEVLEQTKKLTILGKDGKIEQAAIGLGGADNIPRSSDILLSLLLQNGVKLANERGDVTLAETPTGGDTQNPPAAEALRFYTDFARPGKSTYTWNAELPNALELFREGRLAYFLGYSYDAADIAQTSKVRFTVTPLPHPQALLDRGVRIALSNTWLEVVSKKTTHPNEAWDFLQFITAPDQAVAYLEKTHKPSALRTLIDQEKNDPLLAAFAPQTLVAQGWYRGFNSDEMEHALQRAVTTVLDNSLDPRQAIVRAAQQIQQTMTPGY